jgi:phospholipid/cholesterol/gamma-HCH transport system substrate-binding protein
VQQVAVVKLATMLTVHSKSLFEEHLDTHSQQLSHTNAPAHKSMGRFWIGFAIVAALGLMSMSAWRQGWFTRTVHIFVALENGAQGVQVGTLVRLKGFKIGEVDAMTLEPNLDVLVRMRVSEEKLQMINADAKVKLTRDSPISAKYIEFLPGEKAAGILRGESTVPLSAGSDVEDIMLIVKGVVEKLSSALGKIDPILDDVKKISGEAAEMRKMARTSVDAMLINLQNLTQQLKEIGNTANGMAANVDADRAIIMGQIKAIVKTLDATVARDVPQITEKVKATLDNVQSVSMDAKKITSEATIDFPPALRSTRMLVQDISEITDGAKKTWPISSLVKSESAVNPIRLDAFEANK